MPHTASPRYLLSRRQPRRRLLSRRQPPRLLSRRLATRRLMAGIVVGVASLLAGFIAFPPTAQALPGGAGYAVSLGDSYISGEAGRWAGNSSYPSQTDALGPAAYYDAGSGESIRGCHRSKSAEIAIGVLASANLACSGARTTTSPYSPTSDFKPGLDFYDDGAGHLGQALTLQRFAATHRVKLIAVSIGGNDFKFASIVQSCVLDFLTSPSWWKNFCNDDSSVTANFTAASIAAATARIAGALRNVNTAMSRAGYSAGDYALVVQDYPSPLPNGAGIRYPEYGYTRQSTGGCGFYNADANWANSYALPTINGTVRAAVAQSGLSNVTLLDIAGLLNGRRLCESGVHKLNETSLASWQSPSAVDHSEWVEEIRTVTAALGPYYIQESIHPNYWGQLALRSCLRQAFAGGVAHGGTCLRSGLGLNARGEPVVSLR
jgi:hypothetical protein